MSQFRLARLALMFAAIGLNAAPALMHGASAQNNAKPAAPAAAPQDSVRPDLFKLLDPAQIKPLMDAKNYTEVQNRVTQAEAFPDKTPYEIYVVNRMKLSLASATNNDAMQTQALEAVIASGKLAPADQASFTQALAQSYFNAKNYPKAIEMFKQMQANGNNTDAVNAALIRAYYFSGDYATAVKMQGPVLEAQQKAGKTPSAEDLRLYASAANKTKDDAAYLRGLEQLASYYPTDDYWADLISRGIVRKAGFSDANITNVLRLQFAASKAMSPEAYTELAELALKDGFPTEAKKVVDAGFAAGVLGTGSAAAQHRQLRDRANKEAATDAKNIAAGEASAAKAKSGIGLVNLGWAYVTMDQYDKGIGFIEQGIAKGGLKSPDEAKLRLGMAYARAGRKDQAIKTFETVKAGGGLADTAHYWVLLENHPAGGATAAK
ncbi:tetratricopeptide repeat protein [Massilia forsythiae]|uniref:Tetratricopeptide repeat protein n=1 Tax=Massilia forsythiae TaxID=2728020 RepID=A0A7Z2ZQY1_9BURK|nr:tetratricopeptide repeat protein [Massilia forsythiae]QJD98887.1 tetratricopeptide repeat protein [Massilia forsythiae]